MAVKEAELRKALDDNKNAHDRLKVLTDQMGTIRTSTVEEFKSSKAYDDNNTKYFLAGFELFRKQAKEKYLDLDFDVFQPYEDDESMMTAEGGNEGTTSANLRWTTMPLHEFFFLPKQSFENECMLLWGLFGGHVILGS
jgi:hypothetical protein